MNLIEQGIEAIREKGWWKSGRWPNHQIGGRCLLLAIDNGPDRELAALAIAAELGIEKPYGDDLLQGLVNFNDHETTTEEDVLLVMKRAAPRLDKMLEDSDA